MRSGTAMDNWVERDDRRGVDVPAMAYRADGSSLAVKLGNISYDGCQLEADTIFSIGEKVTLALPRMGEVKAQIRWAAQDGKAGARFLVDEIITRACSTTGL